MLRKAKHLVFIERETLHFVLGDTLLGQPTFEIFYHLPSATLSSITEFQKYSCVCKKNIKLLRF